MELDLQQLCSKACEIARNSGKIMAEERLKFDPDKIESKGMHDLVSYVDKESEIRIISALKELLPDAGNVSILFCEFHLNIKKLIINR